LQTLILIGLFFCHFLGDFTFLSTQWMLRAKQKGKPLLPILAHAGVHGLLMLIFLSFFQQIDSWMLLKLAAFQVVTHFIIDVLKGRVKALYATLQDSENRWYWTLYGFDQYLHALVIVAMSYYAGGF